MIEDGHSPVQMTPLTTYLEEIRATRASAAHTAETSFYPALKVLLDAIGVELKPRVRCVMNLRNQGGGLPDGGLFTADQLGRDGAVEPEPALLEAIPSRGAIEVKPPDFAMEKLARSKQVTRYADRYRHVLITNLREFWLVEQEGCASRIIERFSLADNADELWALAAHPESSAVQLGGRFSEFLERVLRTPAPLTSPEDVAWFLASYAREALTKIEHGPVGGFDHVSEALSQTLGVGFQGNKGRHFFNSTLVQTLFYGIFSAWVLWCGEAPAGTAAFSWKDTSELLHVTSLRILFHEMTQPTMLFSRFLREGLDLAEAALNRVDRSQFFARFKEHEAVQYFYEPFLDAFDPSLKKELGVWYTPHEIVSYIVERIDRALRDELQIPNGLADESVEVLDPCCGTGAFLVAVLERIARTLQDLGEDATIAAQVAKAATSRVIGFEILPAPFVVAHMQVGLYLQRLGAQLSPDERAGIYLTNALTGWEKPVGKRPRLLSELAAERDAADRVKQKRKILVVLGNPPYNAFAGVQPEEEQESVDVYKVGLAKKWGIRKFNLDELFVRFFRLAERKIVEQSGRGIVCFISSASYISDNSFVVLRERFLSEFDEITIDNLNGDSRETGKLTPDGNPDPSVFSTERNREGIRVGTAVGLFVLRGKKRKPSTASVRWREFWGVNKRAELLAALDGPDSYASVCPTADQRWWLRPQATGTAYASWTKITDLCEHEPNSGLAEKRRNALIAFERLTLDMRMTAYFDAGRTWDDVRPIIGGLGADAGRFPAKATRDRLLASGEKFSDDAIRRYAILPFDTRWAYHTNARPVWNEPRPALVEQLWPGNSAIICRRTARRPEEGKPTYFTTSLPDHHLLDPNVVAIPLRWRTRVLAHSDDRANLSPTARQYLAELGIERIDENQSRSELLWYHCLAITYSEAYLRDNGPWVRADFPRVPLPRDRSVLEQSAALGKQLAALLDPDVDIPSITTGKIRPELRPLGVLGRKDGRQIDPNAGDLALTARWGALQRESIVMPGPGRVEPAVRVPDKRAIDGEFVDVWLNSDVAWRCVPKSVWEFSIGGYQVLKKWLSYRDRSVVGRDLTLDEARYFTSMVRRVSALVLMAADLDDTYARSAASA